MLVAAPAPTAPAAATTRLAGACFALDATTTGDAAGALVISFWMRFRNESNGVLHDLLLTQDSFTDGAGRRLDYDQTPRTVVGRADLVAPGEGFVTLGRFTTAVGDAPREVRNSIAIVGSTAGGERFGARAEVAIVLEPTPTALCGRSRTGPEPLSGGG